MRSDSDVDEESSGLDEADEALAFASSSDDADAAAAANVAELALERRSLQVRLTAAESSLKERQDELFFTELRLKERTARLAELQADYDGEKRRRKQASAQAEELQKTCQAQFSQNLELQYRARRLSAGNGGDDAGGDGAPVAPRPSGFSKFQGQKDLTLSLLRRGRQARADSQRAARSLEIYESHMMWMEDPQNSSIGNLMECIRQRDERDRRASEGGGGRLSPRGRGTRGSREMLCDASWDLPSHRTVLTTTEDSYIACKLEKSAFGPHLKLMREALTPVVKDFKDSADRAVTQLWYIYSKQRRCLRPKEDFFKETTGMLKKSKMLVAEMLRRMNDVTKDFLKHERPIKEEWRARHHPSTSVACEADIVLPVPVDPYVAELEGDVRMLRERLATLRRETAAREQEAAMARDKAEMSLKFLQGKAVALHTELYAAIHLVYKHRFRWIDRLPNPMRLGGSKAKLDVKFNVRLGGVLDKDATYMKKLGEYFTSDELFGADMSAMWEERSRHKPHELEKQRPQSKMKRRASTPALLATVERQPPRDESPHDPGERDKREFVEWDMSRMQNWHEKQRQLWERRKTTQTPQRDVPYIAAREPSSQQPHAAAEESTTPPPPPPPPPVAKTPARNNSLTSLPEGPLAKASRQRDAEAPKSAELFNRIILRRRTLPLHSASEPTLTDGGGYLLEGNKVMRRAMSQMLL